MKGRFVIVLILLATLSYGQTKQVKKDINIDSLIRIDIEKRKTWIGKEYPAFSVVTNNTEYSNKKLKGKVVFINFWFSTCSPCIAEMEALNKLFEKFDSNPNFEFLSFTFEKQEQIEIIKKKYNIRYKIFSISNKECYRLNLYGGFPTNVVVDTNGCIKYLTKFGETDNFIEIIYPYILDSF